MKSGMNNTLISLIPKVDSLISFAQFKPMSLCNIVYKFVTKLLANCLKKVILNIMSPIYSSFVMGQHIPNNIIIAQEVVHSIRIKKG